MRSLGVCGLLTAVAWLASTLSVQAQNWTTIKGQVVLDKAAKVPEMKKIVPTADKEMCLAKGDFFEETWIVNKTNRGIANVVVYIEPDVDGRKRGDPFPKELIHKDLLKPAKPNAEMDQPCCKFEPHVMALQAGQDLIIKNSAPKPHNANYISSANGEGNPLLPSGGKHELKNLKAERNGISISCSIHPWMSAKVWVFDHPYFALTDEEGKFEIKNAPQGKFRLFVRHETVFNGGRVGAQGTPIKIEGSTLDLKEIFFKPE